MSKSRRDERDWKREKYRALVTKMDMSIKMGYIAEEDWPERPFTKPLPTREREWLAAWLIGEGWTHE